MSEPTSDHPAGATPPPEYGTPPAPPAPPEPVHPPIPEPLPARLTAQPPVPLSPQDERTWGIAAHLSSFAAAYLALGLLGPLIVMLVAGPRSAFVRRHAVEALNFNLSVLIYIAISIPLAFVLIGIPMLVAIGILYLVSVIRGGLAAGRGEEFRYPLTIRFVS